MPFHSKALFRGAEQASRQCFQGPSGRAVQGRSPERKVHDYRPTTVCFRLNLGHLRPGRWWGNVVGGVLFQEPCVLLGNGDRYRLKLCVIVIPLRLGALHRAHPDSEYCLLRQPGQLE